MEDFALNNHLSNCRIAENELMKTEIIKTSIKVSALKIYTVLYIFMYILT